MKKRLIQVAFGSIFVAICYIIHDNQIRKLNLLNENLKSELHTYIYAKQRETYRFDLTISSEGVTLPDISLKEVNGNTEFLSSLIKNKLIVYRFYDNTCSQCIEDELAILKQLGDSIGNNNIIILSNFENIRSAQVIAKRETVKVPFYNYNNTLPLKIEEDPLFVSSFFLLNRDMKTQFVYKAGGEQHIGLPYFRRIISEFKNK